MSVRACERMGVRACGRVSVGARGQKMRQCTCAADGIKQAALLAACFHASVAALVGFAALRRTFANGLAKVPNGPALPA